MFSKKFPPDIQNLTLIKLLMLDVSLNIDDLRYPPSNRIAILSGDRKGQYSIRIDDQWRICFKFDNGKTSEVSADTDLRLCKFFNLSDGYFLRLQNIYETAEAKRKLFGKLKLIPSIEEFPKRTAAI